MGELRDARRGLQDIVDRALEPGELRQDHDRRAAEARLSIARLDESEARLMRLAEREDGRPDN
jgi:hypothetical protein